VTHDVDFAERTDRIIQMKDGRITLDLVRNSMLLRNLKSKHSAQCVGVPF